MNIHSNKKDTAYTVTMRNYVTCYEKTDHLP